MEILGTSLRVCVADLDAAIPVYERLANAEAMRFDNGPVAAAAVGPFILMSGPAGHMEVLRKITATLAVRDADVAVDTLKSVGAEIITGPQPTPIGRSVVARHPDGTIFEYVDRPGADG